MFTGNRGCLVDDHEEVVRHHRGNLWITCVTEFRGRQVGLARPNRWTPLFFLDEAVALAAGHRPCGECRHAAYRSYRTAVESELGRPVSAGDLNAALAQERLRPGRGLDRAGDRKLSTAAAADLPDGVVVLGPGGEARLVRKQRLLAFTFGGWTQPIPRPRRGELRVLTPPTSVAALANGYVAVLHPSAADA
jgi:hypothetical protein